ncbi:hypothetical protein [Natronomonas sp. EA1]|uniref:hypothetical protein n=1 Tax=Natronomonas sp. EA1 TaxID=3421655 RepID=UPI003EB86B52
MTGMKQGAGDDPFASDTEAEPESEVETEADQETTDANAEAGSQDSTAGKRAMPYVLVRDTVKDQRTNEHVYFLRDEFSEVEDELHTAVAEELGMAKKDVYLTDVREALVASADAKAVADVLLEWGYEYKQG